MRLSRRDALAALAAAGAAGSSAVLAGRSPPVAAGDDDTSGDDVDGGVARDDEFGAETDVDEAVVDALTAAAEVLYPSAVEGHREFVRVYAIGRVADDAYREGLARAVADLDDTARDWYGEGYAALDAGDRDELLTQLGVATAEPAPDGPIFARLRYYVVDELLFALYASPTGGRLVGIENPAGYPGGVESYRRARTPSADDSDAPGSAPVDPADVWVDAGDDEGDAGSEDGADGDGTEGGLE